MNCWSSCHLVPCVDTAKLHSAGDNNLPFSSISVHPLLLYSVYRWPEIESHLFRVLCPRRCRRRRPTLANNNNNRYPPSCLASSAQWVTSSVGSSASMAKVVVGLVSPAHTQAHPDYLRLDCGRGRVTLLCWWNCCQENVRVMKFFMGLFSLCYCKFLAANNPLKEEMPFWCFPKASLSLYVNGWLKAI